MSQVSIAATPVAPTVAHEPVQRRRWLREPLLHFLVLGGLLFAIDHVLIQHADNPRTIVIGPEVDSEAVEIFEESRGRKPNQQELTALHRVWLDNEVLYREGLALQVDRGDSAIRERVIFKALSIIDANVKLPPISDTDLRAWFEHHRDKYDEPTRYDFQEAVLADKATQPEIVHFVESLNAGTPGDVKAGLRVFKARPFENLVQAYGADVPKQMEQGGLGVWQAVSTRDGWRAFKLDAVSAPKPADFDSLQGVVMQDWKDAIAAEQRTAAVRELTKKYDVIFEESPK